MRIVKHRLTEMLPGCRIFLDVDNMVQGRGQDDVDISRTVLVLHLWILP